MKLLKNIARRTIGLLPRSESLLSACELYCQRFQVPGYENNVDIHTNGELWLLEEVAPDIRIAFDVGANVGDWTALLLSRARQLTRVYAFEPSRPAFARLLARSFPPSVSQHRMGLSSKPGKALLYVLGEAAPGNSLYQRHGLENGWGIHPSEATEEVTLETIDGFCEQHDIQRIDFVKIDAEGHELDILEGASQSLQKGLIQILQFEYGGTYIDSRRLLKDAFQIVAGLDYTVFLIAPDRLIAYPRYDQRLENFQYKNFVIFHHTAIERSPSASWALAHWAE
jgi:FkbM family methyltransferase